MRGALHVGGAATLAARLHATTPDGRKLFAFEEGGRIVFAGGKDGTHSLCVYATTEARALAHWDGYCQANGVEVDHARAR